MPPNLRQVLFSTHGRISRSQLWLKGFLPLIALCILGICFVFAVMVGGTLSKPATQRALWLMSVILFLVTVWPITAILVKRIHDRNKSGWLVLAYWMPGILKIIVDFRGYLIWVLAFAITGDPTVGQDSSAFSDIMDAIEIGVWIWFFIEFGCMRGTVGANQYGPDPVLQA